MEGTWRKIHGRDVFVGENGCVLRGVSLDGQTTVYPYRKCKTGGWDLDTSMSVAAYRAGCYRETVQMF